MILDARQVGWPRIPQPIDPPDRIWKGRTASFVRYTAESLKNARRSALLAAIYFPSKMRYYTFEKCN